MVPIIGASIMLRRDAIPLTNAKVFLDQQLRSVGLGVGPNATAALWHRVLLATTSLSSE